MKMKKILDVPVPSSAAGSKKPGKAKSKKTPSGHRMRYTEMISSAVQALKKPKGSSRQAITKYVQNNFDVPVNSVNRNVTKNLKQMVSNDQLVLASGVGAAGRFRMNKKAVGSQTGATTTSTASTKKRKPKKPSSPKKKRITKKSAKKKSPIKKKSAKRTSKKPSKPGKRTSKKRPKKKTSKK